MNILLTGIDGYTGWPTALALSKKFKNSKIIGVDNLSRRKWVREIKSNTAITIYSMNERIKEAKDRGFTNIKFIKGDLTNKLFVKNLFKKFDFDVVIHTAAQPSAPYANSNLDRCYFTHFNNNFSTLNILWSIKNISKKKIKLITTTTTGVYGQPNFKIPEGFVTAENKKKRDIIQYGNMGGSWYHITKSNDVNNLWLANKLWGIDIIDLRTSIIYGTSTDLTKIDKKFNTRFDFDYFFGVVINRFCAMSLSNFDLTVYGKGLLKRPFISLEDYVASVVNSVNYKVKGFEVFNQTSQLLCIKDIAKSISEEATRLGFNSKVKNIKNPRVEKELHKMQMENSKFMKLLNKKPKLFEDEIKNTLSDLSKVSKVIKKFKNRFI